MLEGSYTFHHNLSLFILILSPPTFLLLRYVVAAPFGKHFQSTSTTPTKNTKDATNKWGPTVNAKLGWFVFESPNLLWSFYAFRNKDDIVFYQSPANSILFSLFVIHYCNRCILYPLRMSSNSQRVNLSVLASAFSFCMINGYLQAQAFCNFHVYPLEYHKTPLFITGVTLWFVGFITNIQSDSILRNLRKPQMHSSSNPKINYMNNNTTTASISSRNDSNNEVKSRYKIPRGGLFEYVSCANFFGEIVEWCGYALASCSLSSWSFFAFVCANLIPRALSHHSFYHLKFEDYPKDRKAIIPFIW